MNINNITNTSGNWTLISNNIPNINTTVNITATPKKTRNWTGKPRGRTPEQINTLMRNRISYKNFVEQAQQFRKEGIQSECLPFILKYCHACRRQWKGYRYNSNGWYAQQSLDLFLEDIKDYNKREELKLN